MAGREVAEERLFHIFCLVPKATCLFRWDIEDDGPRSDLWLDCMVTMSFAVFYLILSHRSAS